MLGVRRVASAIKLNPWPPGGPSHPRKEPAGLSASIDLVGTGG